jgi:hypothetical protein
MERMERADAHAKAHANRASIQKIPREVLPHGSARLYVLRCAEAGEDVRAERSAAGIWKGRAHGVRYRPAEYLQHYYRPGGSGGRSA